MQNDIAHILFLFMAILITFGLACTFVWIKMGIDMVKQIEELEKNKK